MNVYLVPIGPDGYELYCEPHEAADPDVAGPAGWRARAADVFRRGLAYLEHERQRRSVSRTERSPDTRGRRIRDHVVSWLAERVAEQRLLWHLRRQANAAAYHPDDIGPAMAAEIVVRSLRHDGTRHFRWMLVNAAGVAISSPLTLIPGPNLPFFYFVFRGVGHYLAWSGARHGADGVAWAYHPSVPLTDLRRLPGLPRADRAAFAHAVAGRLGLEHLDTFAERMALRTP